MNKWEIVKGISLFSNAKEANLKLDTLDVVIHSKLELKEGQIKQHLFKFSL